MDTESCFYGISFKLCVLSIADAWQAETIALFTISILVAITRTVIRLHYQKRLFLDDIFLLAAVLCLCGSMVILLYFCTLLYLVENLVIRNSLSNPSPEIVKQTHQYHIVASIYYSFTWTSIFVVKFGFLLFFRNLLLRVQAMMLYWRVVVGITVIVWVSGGVSGVLFCFGLSIKGGKLTNE